MFTDVAPVNFEEIRKALLGVRDGPETSYDSLEPLSLTRSWIEETGFRQPVYVPAAANAAEALGIQLPASEALRVQALAEQLGYGAEVATLDGVGQGPGPRWSMYQWLQYWRAREALVKETQNPKDGQGGGIKRRLSDSSIEDEADSRQVKAGCVLQHLPGFACNIPCSCILCGSLCGEERVLQLGFVSHMQSACEDVSI